MPRRSLRYRTADRQRSGVSAAIPTKIGVRWTTAHTTSFRLIAKTSHSALATRRSPLPSVILWLLCVLALTALALTGFGSGLRGRRSVFSTGALAVLVMAVILVIIALDSPQQTFIRLSQTSLIQLRDSLPAETTTTALPQPAPTLQRETQ
jgi:hypothetical protein